MTAQTVSQAVARRDSGPVSLMWSRRTHFAAVLPASVDVEAFLGTAAGALYASDVPGKKLTLMKCATENPDSLIVALMECAALGHMPGTDEYYLTPRMDHGRPKVLGIEGYRGVIERMYRSGAVSRVIVREVCAGDPFGYVEGRDRLPVHEVGGRGTTGADFFGEHGSRNRGEMVGVYAYAELVTGAISRVVLLTRDDVHAARNSGGWKADDTFSPWNRLDGGPDHPEFTGRSMWWKTGAKRLEPWVPTSREYRREQLRASAAAVAQSAPRAELTAPTAVGATGAGSNGSPDIVEAELVDETAAHVPPADTPSNQGPGREVHAEPGPTAAAAPPAGGTAAAATAKPGPSKAAQAKLEDLMRRIPLGEAEDRAVFTAWVTGHPAAETLTAADVRALTTILEDAEAAAEGDVAEAASQLWQQHKRATGGSDD
jgi:recombination protein RecT